MSATPPNVDHAAPCRPSIAAVLCTIAAFSCSKDQANPPPNLTDAPTTLAADAAPSAAASVPLNVTPVPTASVAEMINPTHAPAYAGPTGVVEGTIYVSGPAAPPLMGKTFTKCPGGSRMYSKTFREGASLPDGRRPLADAVVAITGYSGFIAEKKEAKQVNIVDCAYSARTVTLTLGQRLDIQNKSNGLMFTPVFENQTSPAMMMAPPHGDAVHLYPAQMGRYRVIDKGGYDYMELDVYVLGQPLHAATDDAGHFRIEGVPVGKLSLGARHPFIVGDKKQDIDVQSSTVTKIEITIAHDKDALRPADTPEGPQLP